MSPCPHPPEEGEAASDSYREAALTARPTPALTRHRPQTAAPMEAEVLREWNPPGADRATPPLTRHHERCAPRVSEVWRQPCCSYVVDERLTDDNSRILRDATFQLIGFLQRTLRVAALPFPRRYLIRYLGHAARREKIHRSYPIVGADAGKKNYDDFVAAIEAVKALMLRLVS